MIGISILSVIVLLGVLIFAHELGHFLAAKWAGVGVLKFSLGFGRKIYGRRIGETGFHTLGLRRFRPRNTNATRPVAG